jgi:DNA-binding XRE family transcriptional regulator
MLVGGWHARQSPPGRCLECINRDPGTSLGERLKAVRLAAGFTQQEVAFEAGMLLQQIAKYEYGEIEPLWPTLLRLARALGPVVVPSAASALAGRVGPA